MDDHTLKYVINTAIGILVQRLTVLNGVDI